MSDLTSSPRIPAFVLTIINAIDIASLVFLLFHPLNGLEHQKRLPFERRRGYLEQVLLREFLKLPQYYYPVIRISSHCMKFDLRKCILNLLANIVRKNKLHLVDSYTHPVNLKRQLRLVFAEFPNYNFWIKVFQIYTVRREL